MLRRTILSWLGALPFAGRAAAVDLTDQWIAFHQARGTPGFERSQKIAPPP